MTSFTEFLKTASTDNVIATQQANEHEQIVPVFITSNTLTVYVVSAGLYDIFTDVANDSTSPVRGICMALMDRLRGDSEFNLSESLPMGQANIAMLDTLIAALPAHADKINGLKNTLLSISNKKIYPFLGMTLHDTLLVRNACPTTSVSASNGYVLFTTTAETPRHSVRVFGTNPRTGRQVILGNVSVSDSGMYEFRIPTHYAGFTDLKIDNAYGVVSNGN